MLSFLRSKREVHSPLPNIREDIAGYLREEAFAKQYPARLVEVRVAEGLRRFDERQKLREQDGLVPYMTIRELSKSLDEFVYDQMTPDEQLAWKIAQMPDRALLEAVYRKLCT